MRRPLGTDLRGRRYWAFGHKAGCWRIFVEGPEASAWGWYEGAHIPKLVQWLKSANIERETSLRRALEAVPIPMKFNSDPVPPTPLPLAPAPSGDVKPTVYWTPTDLKNRRPDGYKLLDAPLLRGEYHQVSTWQGRHPRSMDRDALSPQSVQWERQLRVLGLDLCFSV